MFVLDTNTVIDFFRGEGRIASRLAATHPSEIAIPSVVLYELETGIARSSGAARRRQPLDAFLANLTVLPFDVIEARAAATIRARLEQAGTPIGPLDTLIAATALAHEGTLVTRNLREFTRIPELRVENWFDG